MKKINFKKIIVAVFSFALLVTAQNTFAATTWNSASNDCKSISIANASTTEGYADPCWPSTSVSADGGDTLNVRIYYHNNGTETANNTIVKLNAPIGGSASSTKSFSGSINSDQGGISLNTVTANLSSSQTLTFNSVKWYTNNKSETLTNLPNGQSGSAILSGGLNLGSIAPGWPTQGSLVVSFHVSNNDIPVVSNCSISNFQASPSNITSGNLSAISWNTTSGCSHVTLSGFGTQSDSGSVNVYPLVNTTYTLIAYDTNGTLAESRDLTITVNGNNNTSTCSIINFESNDYSISDGDSAVLSWDTTSGCDHVNITSIGNNLSTSDSQRVYPTSSKTYTLTAYNYNGVTVSQSLRIIVDNSNNDNNNYNYCTISNFTANGSTYNLSINQGDVLRLVWDTQGCSSVRVSGSDFTSSSISGNKIIYPSVSGNYTISAYSSGSGTRTQTIYVTINQNGNNNYIIPQLNACTVTTVATSITSNGAQLNGLISNSTNSSVNTSFNYGTTTNLGSQTTVRTVNGNGSFSEYITGLAPDTYYYFRAISNCSNGQLGNIDVFKTSGTGYVNNNTNTTTRTIIQGTTVTGTESPIMLRIENKYQAIGSGDLIDYSVYYKNIGKSTLSNPVLQVVLPKGVVLTNSSRGTYSADSNTLSIPLENLNPGAEGVIYLQGRVDYLTSGYAQIVTTAILVYTTPSGAQENAIAYVLNNPKIVDSNSLLGASAFFGGNFLGLGLIGWLLLIIIILLIILAARSYRNKITETHTYTDSGTSH